MVKYVKYKTKTFKLKKDASKWVRDTKKSSPGIGLKSDINYNPDNPYPWEAVLLSKGQ